jgi:hypothetical protein
MDMQTTFRSQLYAAGLLFPTGVDGLVGRNGVFESIFTGLETAITRAGLVDKPEVMRFPAMAQQTFERSGYMKNFPHFAGTVHCFCGDDKAHHQLLGKMARERTGWTSRRPPTSS